MFYFCFILGYCRLFPSVYLSCEVQVELSRKKHVCAVYLQGPALLISNYRNFEKERNKMDDIQYPHREFVKSCFIQPNQLHNNLARDNFLEKHYSILPEISMTRHQLQGFLADLLLQKFWVSLGHKRVFYQILYCKANSLHRFIMAYKNKVSLCGHQ